MTIQIKNTKGAADDSGIKALVYGRAGIGKTSLMATAPRPIILSCESGLLSLNHVDVPYIEIKTVQDLEAAFEYVSDSPDFDTICLDSVSEIAEVYLSALKKEFKDPRQSYDKLGEVFFGVMREFRDLKGKNVLFAAKTQESKDDFTGITSLVPAMPGKKLSAGIPFLFDEVFYMTLVQDSEGAAHRCLMTQASMNYEAKDRSGALGPIEQPNLTAILNKIKAVKNG